MEIFEKETHDLKALVFLDLEATSFTSEMIEIGAYLAKIDEKGMVTKVFPPFKRYIKANHEIGTPVTKLTGITEDLLKKEGHGFQEIMSSFRKYVGRFWEDCRFVTFGEHDMVIIKNTMAEHRDIDPRYARNIYRHHLDLQRLLSFYIQDENGNPYSLANYLKIFGLEFDGKAHDAVYDALNLLDLYKKAIVSEEIFEQGYKKTLINNKKPIIRELIKRLNSGQTITPEIYEDMLRRTFK